MSIQQQLRRDVAIVINANTPAVGELWSIVDWSNRTVIGDGSEQGGIPLNPLGRGYIDGLELSLSVVDALNDITVTAGQCRDAGHAADMLSPSPMTKQIDAPWSPGNDAGGFPSTLTGGLVQPNTWYDFYAIGQMRNGTIVDFGFDAAGSNAANLLADASYGYYRRLLSVKTDGGGNLVPFRQEGDNVLIDDRVISTNTGNVSYGPLSLASYVPPGVRVFPILTQDYQLSGGSPPLVTTYFGDGDGDVTGSQVVARSSAASTAYAAQGPFQNFRTDLSGNIRFGKTRSGGVTLTSYNLRIHGYIDRRGRGA